MERIGRYEVLSELGRGAMGVVYRAKDTRIGRELAVKVIRLPEHGAETELEQLRARLFREAQSAGRLSHKGIVTIYDVDEREGVAYIAMEFVAGRTLSDVLRDDTLNKVVSIPEMLRQLAAGLDYAHSKGVVHRDIKPANIMISDTGMVKIMDFGIARLSSSTLTQTGAALGTPRYMSPEQVKGEHVDGRSDQFSLAVMTYEILTGRPPFEGDAPTTVAVKIVTTDPPAPSAVSQTVAPGLDEVLLRALSKDPENRFPSCAEFAEAVARIYAQYAPEEPQEDPDAQTMVMGTMAAGVNGAEETVLDSTPTGASIAGAAPQAPVSNETLVVDSGSMQAPPVETPPAAPPEPAKAPEPEPPVAAVKSEPKPDAPAAPPPQPEPAFRAEEPQKSGGRTWLMVAAGVVVVLLAAGGFWFFQQSSQGGAPATSNTAAPAEVAQLNEPSPPPAEEPVTEPPVQEAVAVEPPAPEPTPEPETPAPAAVKPAPVKAPPAPPVSVQFTSNPPGTQISVDGDSNLACATPCSLDLRQGEHVASARLAGYQFTRRTFEVGAGTNDVAFEMQPLTGVVMISSQPAGAAIFVDGNEHNQVTNARLSLPVGKHSVRLVSPDGITAEREIDVTDGGLLHLQFTLQ